MLLQDRKIMELTVDEYFYLTENLDMIDASRINNGIKFLVVNKKRKLYNVVKEIISNELTMQEQQIVKAHWYDELSIGEIEEKFNISRAKTYRLLDSAKKKLDMAIKYVLLYEENLIPKTTDELMVFIGEENIEH
jgi:DNA-directed RNA polymerase specialized sigma subunit